MVSGIVNVNNVILNEEKVTHPNSSKCYYN